MPEKRTLYLCLNICSELHVMNPLGLKMRASMPHGAFGIMTVYETLDQLREYEGEDARYEVLENEPRAEEVSE